MAHDAHAGDQRRRSDARTPAAHAATAALAVIRLSELQQTHTPIFAAVLARLIATQRPDGGWGLPVVTALATRALLGVPEPRGSAARGLEHLVALQRDDGAFPALATLRTGGEARFAEAARLGAALRYLAEVREQLPPAHRQLVRLAITRSRHQIAGQARALLNIADEG